MKTAKTSTLSGKSILFFTLILIATLCSCEKTQVKDHVKQEQVSVFERYEAVLNLKSTSIRQITHTYPLEDKIEVFTNRQNLTQNRDNIASIFPSFHLASIFFLDASKKPTFSHKIAIQDFKNLNLSTFNPYIYSVNGFTC